MGCLHLGRSTGASELKPSLAVGCYRFGIFKAQERLVHVGKVHSLTAKACMGVSMASKQSDWHRSVGISFVIMLIIT